jgi:hypothetical protein
VPMIAIDFIPPLQSPLQWTLISEHRIATTRQ